LLRRAGGLAALPLGASLAAACSDTTEMCGGKVVTSGGAAGGPATPTGPGGIPLARRDAPVYLRKYSDVAEIASGLKPEAGPLKLYNWNDYIDPNLLKAFGKKYNTKVEVTTFTTMDEAMSKLAAGGLEFDVLIPTVSRLADLVSQDLLRPLNHDYIPNLRKNVWPQFTNPFYDFGAHYSVPYTIYSVGLSWRNDKITDDIAAMPNPWDALWNATAYKGRVAILDDARDALATAMVRRGLTDINTEDPKVIDQARSDLQELVSKVDVKITTSQYQDIPDGKLWLAQDWSGDIIAGAMYNRPTNVPAKVLSYWAPPQPQLSNDLMSVLASGKNPVLAHLFLDFLLDADNALQNMRDYNGYQPPQNSLDPETLPAKLGLPKSIAPAIVTQQAYENGLAALSLTATGDAAWQAAWAQLKAG
jgi:spermidine/putrescine transport system substrate-binding protein